MKKLELIEMIKNEIDFEDMFGESNLREYDHYGVRFEYKRRERGDIITDLSKELCGETNREFPEYGTDEYSGLEDLGGVSAWMIDTDEWWIKSIDCDGDSNEEYDTEGMHCYILGSNSHATHDDADRNEIVLLNPKIIEVIF